MRAKAITSLLAATAFATALLLGPATAVAKPGFHKFRGFHGVQLTTRGTHGYFIFVSVLDGRAQIVAERPESDGGLSLVIYRQSARRTEGDNLDASFGRAGNLRARFVHRKVEKRKPLQGCSGGATIYESGYFVGSMTFHGMAGFTSFHAHRLRGFVTRQPAQICHTSSSSGQRFFQTATKGVRRLITGNPSGTTRFEATTFPAEGREPARTEYEAKSERTEGGVTIFDSVSVPAEAASPFVVPTLTAPLPANATVEPPSPSPARPLSKRRHAARQR